MELLERKLTYQRSLHLLEVNKNFHDPNQVKVVLDQAGFALYFSRSPIPYERDMVKRVNRSCLSTLACMHTRRNFSWSFLLCRWGLGET